MGQRYAALLPADFSRLPRRQLRQSAGDLSSPCAFVAASNVDAVRGMWCSDRTSWAANHSSQACVHSWHETAVPSFQFPSLRGCRCELEAATVERGHQQKLRRKQTA